MTLPILDRSTPRLMHPDALVGLARSLDGRSTADIRTRRTVSEQRADLRGALASSGYTGMQELEGTLISSRVGGTAIIPIIGTIWPRPTFDYWEWMFGGQSTDLISVLHDLEVAINTNGITDVLLYVDSPGGLANGVADAADEIHRMRGTKPIRAFVADTAASAAYWLASAADEIVASRTAYTGSIGVLTLYVDFTELDKRIGIQQITFISSQSPAKVDDPKDAAGASRIQRRLDDLAGVFVEKVARNRGVTTKAVLETFSGGDILIADRALAVGLVDSIGSFESTIGAETPEGTQPAPPDDDQFARKTVRSQQEKTMSAEAKQAKAERAFNAAIQREQRKNLAKAAEEDEQDPDDKDKQDPKVPDPDEHTGKMPDGSECSCNPDDENYHADCDCENDTEDDAEEIPTAAMSSTWPHAMTVPSEGSFNRGMKKAQ